MRRVGAGRSWELIFRVKYENCLISQLVFQLIRYNEFNYKFLGELINAEQMEEQGETYEENR